MYIYRIILYRLYPLAVKPAVIGIHPFTLSIPHKTHYGKISLSVEAAKLVIQIIRRYRFEIRYISEQSDDS